MRGRDGGRDGFDRDEGGMILQRGLVKERKDVARAKEMKELVW